MNSLSKFDYHVTVLRNNIKEAKKNDFEDFQDVVVQAIFFFFLILQMSHESINL